MIFRSDRELYITAKYVDKKFTKSSKSHLIPNPGPPRSSSFHENLLYHVNSLSNDIETQLNIDKNNSSLERKRSSQLTNSDTKLNENIQENVENEAIVALETGDVEVVLKLMANRFDLNQRLHNNSYPLHIAIENVKSNSKIRH